MMCFANFIFSQSIVADIAKLLKFIYLLKSEKNNFYIDFIEGLSLDQ